MIKRGNRKLALVAALMSLAMLANGAARPTGRPPVTTEAVAVIRLVVAAGKIEVRAGTESRPFSATWLVRGGTLLVPANDLAELIGATLEEDHQKGSVTFIAPGRALSLFAGSPEALVDGWRPAAITADAAVTPVWADGFMLVPLRFITQYWGTLVVWDVPEALVGPAPNPPKLTETPKPDPPPPDPGDQLPGDPALTGERRPPADQTGVPWGWFRVAGVVTDDWGDPVSGASVTARSKPRQPRAEFLRSPALAREFQATTARDGSYHLDLAAGSAYDIRGWKPCYTDERATVDSGVLLDLAIAPAVTPIGNSRGPAPNEYWIYGYVRDQAGSPLAGACVVVTGEEQEGISQRKSTASGYYVAEWKKWDGARVTVYMPGCEPGRYNFRFKSGGSSGEGGPQSGSDTPSRDMGDRDMIRYESLTRERTVTFTGYGSRPDAELRSFQYLDVWCGPKPTPKPKEPPQPPVECRVNYATIHVTNTTRGPLYIVVTQKRTGIAVYAGLNFENLRVSPGIYRIEIWTLYGGDKITDREVDLNPCGFYKYN